MAGISTGPAEANPHSQQLQPIRYICRHQVCPWAAAAQVPMRAYELHLAVNRGLPSAMAHLAPEVNAMSAEGGEGGQRLSARSRCRAVGHCSSWLTLLQAVVLLVHYWL